MTRCGRFSFAAQGQYTKVSNLRFGSHKATKSVNGTTAAACDQEEFRRRSVAENWAFRSTGASSRGHPSTTLPVRTVWAYEESNGGRAPRWTGLRDRQQTEYSSLRHRRHALAKQPKPQLLTGEDSCTAEGIHQASHIGNVIKRHVVRFPDSASHSLTVLGG